VLRVLRRCGRAGDEIEEGGRELYFGKKVANHNFKAVAGNKRKERTSELAASGEEEGREVGQKKEEDKQALPGVRV